MADVAGRFGYQGIYTDWKRLLADPEVEIFDNCTPDDRHAAPSIAAAAAGKHVICEKPLAMTVEDAAAMVEAVEKAGVKHMICYNYRFIPAVRLARQLIEQGAIGKIYHFRGCYLQEPGHDPAAPLEDCWYTTRHPLRHPARHRLPRHRHGALSRRRDRLGERSGADLERHPRERDRRDRGASPPTRGTWRWWSSPTGATGTLESSGVATGRKNQQTWEINGSKGSLRWDLEDPNHLWVYTDERAPRTRAASRPVSVTDPGHPLQTVYLPPGHNAGWEYGHVHALHHFVDCVVNGTSVAPYGATFEDGYRIQVIMEAIVESSRDRAAASTSDSDATVTPSSRNPRRLQELLGRRGAPRRRPRSGPGERARAGRARTARASRP